MQSSALQDSRIEAHVTHDQDAVMEVEDTGIGTGPEHVPDLLSAFKREPVGINRKYENSGLGLSILKWLTEEVDGTIKVETQKRTQDVLYRLPAPFIRPSLTLRRAW